MQAFLAQAGGNTPNYIQIIVFALMISISVISWLVKVVAQKREEAKVRAARKAREEELLRTGRAEDGRPTSQPLAPVAAPIPASHDEARRRLQEIAQRRRAELEQMARQGGGSAATGTSHAPQPVPQVVPAAPMSRTLQPRPLGPAGPAFPTARPKPEPQRAKAAPRQDQRKKKQPIRPAQQPQQRPAPRATEPQTLAEKLMDAPAEATGVYAVVPQAVHAAESWVPGGGRLGTATKVTLDSATTPEGIAALRKAIVLAELLAPPLSARQDESGSTEVPMLRRAG